MLPSCPDAAGTLRIKGIAPFWVLLSNNSTKFSQRVLQQNKGWKMMERWHLSECHQLLFKEMYLIEYIGSDICWEIVFQFSFPLCERLHRVWERFCTFNCCIILSWDALLPSGRCERFGKEKAEIKAILWMCHVSPLCVNNSLHGENYTNHNQQ